MKHYLQQSFFAFLLAFMLGAAPLGAMAQEEAENDGPKAVDLQTLLELIEQGRFEQDQELAQREARFRASRNQQAALLREAQAERQREEERSLRLEAEFEKNQNIIITKREQLNEKLGSLIELFGHMTAAIGDLRSNFETSLVSAQFPGRIPFLDELNRKISESDTLPSIEEVERLWFEFQREITESGKVVSFKALVVDPDGTREERDVTRVGLFNIVDDDGNYLSWNIEKQFLEKLARQPKDKFTGWAENVTEADEDEIEPFAIDPTGPTGGSYLSSLIDAPTFTERWHQGGPIGYLITLLGLFALCLALYKIKLLGSVRKLVQGQLGKDAPNKNNPLGRVLSVYEENKDIGVEALELKVAEAILKERPTLERGHALLKIIAAVAPLMGLLGTVTGMILTFQGIVIFGAGDPKAMAGGISQALITTVLGLLVAIPTILLHTIASGRSNGILYILEEQATGLIAQRAESKN